MSTTNKPFRPMLAATIEDDVALRKLLYPLIGSPKVDGIRCYCHPELGPVSRSLKPIPNVHIRSILSHPDCKGLDGEIIIGHITAKDVFNRTTSGVMSRDGAPDFQYWTFDHYEPGSQIPYFTRLQRSRLRVQKIRVLHEHVQGLECYLDIKDANEALGHEALAVERGFEGLMLRHPGGPYKHGRSTFKEQSLLKLKRFIDDEATITGFQELQHNTNQKTTNALGLSERSSHRAGQSGGNVLGTLLVSHPKYGEFGIGSGFDSTLRGEIWRNQEKYRGKQVTFKYQACGVVDKPRFPIFLRFRPEE